MRLRIAPSPAPRLGSTAAALALTAALTVGLAAAAPVAFGDPGSGTGARRAVAAQGPAATAAATAVTHARAAYDEARGRVDLVGAQRARLAQMSTAADERAASLRAQVADQDGGALDAVLGLISGDDSTVELAAEAAQEAEQARALLADTEQALSEAIAETEGARRSYDDALAAQAHVQAGWTARQVATAAASLAELPDAYLVEDRAQDRRNRAALRRWHRYLDDLARAAVVPPAAELLADPDRLPEGLGVARDTGGAAVPGLASAERPDGLPVTVLPSETVTAVSTAFGRLGLSDVPGANTAASYACGGLPAHAWGTTTTLPADSVAQWRELRSVPRGSVQVGDVVVLGDRSGGLEETGIYVGEGQAILADPETGTAGVRPLPVRRLFGVKRVELPVTRTYDAPAAGACGAEEPVASPGLPGSPDSSGFVSGSASVEAPAGGPALLSPVSEGSYQLSAGFGQAGEMWSADHTGQDFAAPLGTEVVASAAGVVTVERPAWAGILVRIDHGGGVETWYAHLSATDVVTGQQVRRGERIGAVGSEGNSTGPHLHFELRLDGDPVAPALALRLPGAPSIEYPNGEVPAERLCAATPDGAQLLRCDAAVSYRLLAAAYADALGADLCMTDSYRSRDGQDQLFRAKPTLAAKPGTSVHGFGLAVDLCGGVERFGTPEHRWLVDRGPDFGWVHPSWAAAGGSRPEPWHFEFHA